MKHKMPLSLQKNQNNNNNNNNKKTKTHSKDYYLCLKHFRMHAVDKVYCKHQSVSLKI